MPSVPRLCLSQARRPEAGKVGAAAAAHEQVLDGTKAASKKSGRQYSHDAFIGGELGIPVANFVNPAVVGPDWDWVKAVDKAAEEAAASEVVAAMEEQIQKTIAPH